MKLFEVYLRGDNSRWPSLASVGSRPGFSFDILAIYSKLPWKSSRMVECIRLRATVIDASVRPLWRRPSVKKFALPVAVRLIPMNLGVCRKTERNITEPKFQSQMNLTRKHGECLGVAVQLTISLIRNIVSWYQKTTHGCPCVPRYLSSGSKRGGQGSWKRGGNLWPIWCTLTTRGQQSLQWHGTSA